MKRILTLLAFLLSVPAFAVGPNGVSGTISVANANGTTGACTALSCVNQPYHQNFGGGTIFTGSQAWYSTASIQITGTWVGTISFQYSQDEGATWQTGKPIYQAPLENGVYPVTSTAANGNWIFSAQGMTTFRAVATAWTSGSATVAIEQMLGPAIISLTTLPNSARPTYTASLAVTVPTSASSMFAIEAGGSKRWRLRSLCIGLSGVPLQTTAGHRQVSLFATTAASSGGATATPNVVDPNDGAFSGVLRSGAITTTPAIGAPPTAIWSWDVFFPTATAAQMAPVQCLPFDGTGGAKQFTVNAGTANGLALGDFTGGAGGAGNYVISAAWTEEAN